MRRLIIGVAIAVGAFAAAMPAHAAPQTVDATLGSSLSMTTSPTSSVSGWALASTGANSTSGGSVAVNTNQPYIVSVTGDKATMTEYVTASSAYATGSPKSLGSPLTVAATHSGGTAPVAGAGAAAVVGVSPTLATGLGLGTDSYDVTLSQPTTIADPALPSGRTYHIVLTYTLSSTL